MQAEARRKRVNRYLERLPAGLPLDEMFQHVYDEMDSDFVSGATVSASALPVRHLPAAAPHEWIGGSGNGGIRYTLDSAGLAALVALSFSELSATNSEAIYRIAAKGVPIQLGPDRWTIHSATSDAILSYERRRDLFETDLGRAGFWWEPRALRPLRPELCGLLGCPLVRGSCRQAKRTRSERVLQTCLK